MPKKKLPADVIEFFRKHGSKGGKQSAAGFTAEERQARARAAAAAMTPEERSERARRAVAAREAKRAKTGKKAAARKP